MIFDRLCHRGTMYTGFYECETHMFQQLSPRFFAFRLIQAVLPHLEQLVLRLVLLESSSCVAVTTTIASDTLRRA